MTLSSVTRACKQAGHKGGWMLIGCWLDFSGWAFVFVASHLIQVDS